MQQALPVARPVPTHPLVAQPVTGPPVAQPVVLAQPAVPPGYVFQAQPQPVVGTYQHQGVAEPPPEGFSPLVPPPLPIPIAQPAEPQPGAGKYAPAAVPVGITDNPYQSLDGVAVGVPIDPPVDPFSRLPIVQLRGPGSSTGVLQGLRVHVDIHLATAFVTLSGILQAESGDLSLPPSRRVLCVPMDEEGTITSCWCRIESAHQEPRIVRSIVVSRGDLRPDRMKQPQAPDQHGQSAEVEAESHQYMPHVFRFPLDGVHAGDNVRFHATYMEPLEFFAEDARYSIRVPLRPPSGMLPAGVQSLSQICSVTCSINTGSGEVQWGPTSIPTTVNEADSPAGYLAFESTRTHWWDPERDFTTSYKLMAREPMCAVLVQDPALVARSQRRDPYSVSMPTTGLEPEEEEVYFSILLAPPAPQYRRASCFPRTIYFVLDQSYSMSGEPLRAAKQAVCEALRGMLPGDRFGIIAFNHESPQVRRLSESEDTFMFEGGTVQPIAEDVTARALAWVESVQVNGATNIMDQTVFAFEMLRQDIELGLSAKSLPFVFLITDGCVRNERDICHWVTYEQSSNEFAARIRMCCLGIGPFCNSSFLRQLAKVGRGYSSIALKEASIQVKMKKLVQQASDPVLSNLSLSTPLGLLPQSEIYPLPLPDLFGGQPVIVSGVMKRAHLPQEFVLAAEKPGGERWAVSRVPMPTGIPVGLVFARERINLLTSDIWLAAKGDKTPQVIEASCQYGIPCNYTSCVGQEMTEYEYRKQQVAKREKQTARQTNAELVAICAGGAVLLGVGLFAFGDFSAAADAVGATSSAFGDLATGRGNVGDIPFNLLDMGTGGGDNCCDCDCDVECGECGECGDCSGLTCGGC